MRGEGEHYWGGSEGRNVSKGTYGNGELCRGGRGADLEEKGRKKKSVLLRKVGIKKRENMKKKKETRRETLLLERKKGKM